MSLLNICDELLLLIAEFLPEEDVVSLMSTCKLLWRLFEGGSFWKNRYLKYSSSFTFNSDFSSDANPSWRLLTVDNNSLHDQLFYSVDATGQRGFHTELKCPQLSVPFLKGNWKQALFSLLDRRCENCRAYCGTVHVMLLARVCDRCAFEGKRYSVVLKESLLSCGVKENDLEFLPFRMLKVESEDIGIQMKMYYSLEHCQRVFQTNVFDRYALAGR